MQFSIETNRLVLRPFTLEDARDFFYLLRDASILKYIDFCYFESVDEVREVIQNCYSVCDFMRDFYLVIEDKTSHKIIGSLIVTKSAYKDEYEVCYLIGKSFRRNGYMKEAILAFIDCLPISNICLTFIINETNIASLQTVKCINNIREEPYSLIGYRAFYYDVK